MFQKRIVAFCIHLSISLVVAFMAALVVFGIWYPFPYRDVSGGRELFTLLISVDVVLGPVLTFFIFNQKKSRRELTLDVGCIAAFQVAALVYGLWTVASARPVHLVFELDRFRVVHAIDVPDELLGNTPSGIVAKPWTGPTVLSIRAFESPQESADMTLAAIQGLNLSFRPELWQTYATGLADVKKAAKPLALLLLRIPILKSQIASTVDGLGYSTSQLAALPLISRSSYWTVLIHADTGEILAYLPVDTFE